MLYFVNALQSSILSSLLPFVTSNFESHSLLNVIYIVADALSAAIYVPLSKIMDVWGRPQGFAFMTTLATIGLIMMAACHNLPTFCAAYVRLSITVTMICTNANSKHIGLLHHWVRWHDLLRGCYHC